MKEITQDKFIYKSVAFIMCKLLYRVKYVNVEKMPKDGAFLLCSNHLCNADPIFICAYGPRIARFMAKKELFTVPVLKDVITALGAFPVDRGNVDLPAIRKGLSLLSKGEPVGIFPQGTTHYKGMEPRTTPTKTGLGMLAVRSKATIFPVALKVKGNKVHLFSKIEVIYGDPIPASEYGIGEMNPDEYRRITDLAFDRICSLLEQ